MAVSQAQNFYKETVTIPWTTGGGNFYVSVKPTISSGFLVISPNNISLREIVKFTATGTDGSGDYVTVTAPNRGLGGTTEQTHIVGESVFINVTAQHIDEIIADLALKLDDSQLDVDGTLAANDDTKIASQKATKTYADTKVSKTGNETIAGVKTFSSSPVVPAPTADFEAATKKYADDLAIAGAPNASETVKGIVEMATSAQADAGTDTGETGAPLFVKPSKLLALIAAGAYSDAQVLALLRDQVEVTTGTTHSLTTNGTERVIVFAKGYKSGNNNSTITLQYNGVTKDTVVQNNGGGSFYDNESFALMYTEVPSAATQNITVNTTAGTLANVRILVIKL